MSPPKRGHAAAGAVVGVVVVVVLLVGLNYVGVLHIPGLPAKSPPATTNSTGPVPVEIGSMTFSVDPALDGQSVSEPVIPYTSSADTGSFTANPDGSCSFFVTAGAPAGGGAAEALIVTVDDKSGSPLGGATVQVTATGISVTLSPSASATTDSTGQASWSSITGTIPAGDNAGGEIDLSAAYSSGGVSSTGSATIDVESPASMSC